MLTVADLEQMLKDAPKHLRVLVMAPNQPLSGQFAFVDICPQHTGVATFGPASKDNGEQGEPEGAEVFLVMPHGAGVTEEELDEMSGKPDPTIDN